MAKGFLKFKSVRCGAYRGIEIFEIEMAGIKSFSIRLGLDICSSADLNVLRLKIDEWYLLKRN